MGNESHSRETSGKKVYEMLMKKGNLYLLVGVVVVPLKAFLITTNETRGERR